VLKFLRIQNKTSSQNPTFSLIHVIVYQLKKFSKKSDENLGKEWNFDQIIYIIWWFLKIVPAYRIRSSIQAYRNRFHRFIMSLAIRHHLLFTLVRQWLSRNRTQIDLNHVINCYTRSFRKNRGKKLEKNQGFEGNCKDLQIFQTPTFLFSALFKYRVPLEQWYLMELSTFVFRYTLFISHTIEVRDKLLADYFLINFSSTL
jgi:hypothetical protein